MTKAVRLALLFGIAWAMQSGVSFAMEDWLDRLSGPGPFFGVDIGYRFACVSNTADQMDFRALGSPEEKGKTIVTWLSPRDRTATPYWVRRRAELQAPVGTPAAEQLATYRKDRAAHNCTDDQRLRGYLTVTSENYWSYSNELVTEGPQVRLHGLDLTYTDRENRATEISLRLTHFWFEGDSVNDVGAWAFTPSIQFAPLAVTNDSSTARWLKFSAGVTLFFKRFEAADFGCVASNPACRIPNWDTAKVDFVPHIGIVLDPGVARSVFGSR